jgi:hypothetical protein
VPRSTPPHERTVSHGAASLGTSAVCPSVAESRFHSASSARASDVSRQPRACWRARKRARRSSPDTAPGPAASWSSRRRRPSYPSIR